MPGTPTTRFAIPTLGGTDAINTSHTAINNGFGAVDSNMTGYLTGTFATKPTPNKEGRIYRCSDTGQLLFDNGSAWVDLNAAPAFVTSLPGSPYDGQEIYYSADPTNGVVWHLRYRSASASAYKWELVGGGMLVNEVQTSEHPVVGAFSDAPTVGPQITVPLAGDYEIQFGMRARPENNAVAVYASLKFGAAAETGNDEVVVAGPLNNVIIASVSRSARRTVSAAGQLVKLRYRADSGNAANTFISDRFLLVRPVRVG